MEKKWYKKFKVLTGMATLIIEAIILIVVQIIGKPISPEVLTFMKYVFAIGISIISGHALTDTVTAISKTKK